MHLCQQHDAGLVGGAAVPGPTVGEPGGGQAPAASSPTRRVTAYGARAATSHPRGRGVHLGDAGRRVEQPGGVDLADRATVRSTHPPRPVVGVEVGQDQQRDRAHPEPVEAGVHRRRVGLASTITAACGPAAGPGRRPDRRRRRPAPIPGSQPGDGNRTSSAATSLRSTPAR